MAVRTKFQQALELYGVLENEKYVIGNLEIDKYGYVWAKEEVKQLHYVGHINTVKELQGVCELWNNKQLEEYGK